VDTKKEQDCREMSNPQITPISEIWDWRKKASKHEGHDPLKGAGVHQGKTKNLHSLRVGNSDFFLFSFEPIMPFAFRRE
jgi:hypothetical protein